jgi:hypothetical protein
VVDLGVKKIFLIGLLLIVGCSSPECDSDSAEKFAVKRLTISSEIIAGPHLKSENPDDCTFTFTARTKMEPRWDPMQQKNRVAILDNEITVGKRKGKWEVLDVESSYIKSKRAQMVEDKVSEKVNEIFGD